MAGSRSDFAGWTARESLCGRKNRAEAWLSRIDCSADRAVNSVMLRGNVDGLSSHTEPGAKRVRMRTGLVVPMFDLVSGNLR